MQKPVSTEIFTCRRNFLLVPLVGSRDGRMDKPTTIRFPASHKQRLRMVAAERGVTMEDVVVEAFESYISGKSGSTPPTEAHTVPALNSVIGNGEKADNGFTKYSKSDQKLHDMLQEVLDSGHHQSRVLAIQAIKSAHDLYRAVGGELSTHQINPNRPPNRAAAAPANDEAEAFIGTHHSKHD
jgi:hypothetical protein